MLCSVSLQNILISLIYQCCVDLNVGVMARRDARGIHESFVHGRSQCATQRVSVNAASKNDRYYHVVPLKILISKATAIEGQTKI